MRNLQSELSKTKIPQQCTRFKIVMFLFVKLLNVYLTLIIYVRNVDFVIAICMFLKNDPGIFPFFLFLHC